MSQKLLANDYAIKKNEAHQYNGKILIITQTSKFSHPQSYLTAPKQFGHSATYFFQTDTTNLLF